MKKSSFVEKALLNWHWWVALPYMLFMLSVAIVFILPFSVVGNLFKWAGEDLLYFGDCWDRFIRNMSKLDKVLKWVDKGWKKM